MRSFYRNFFFKWSLTKSLLNNKYFFSKKTNIFFKKKKNRFFKKKGFKIKNYLYFYKNFILSNKVNNYHYYNIIFFLNYGYFRSNNSNTYIRFNFNVRLYVFIKNSIEVIFDINAFPKFYLKSLTDSFIFLCFTKTLNVFSLFIKKLLSRLSRVGQKNFFFSFSCIDYPVLTTFLKKLFIFGFFLKSTGKIAGYAGDRTKSFYLRFGNCSRSIKIFKFLYKQTVSFTKNGVIGSNFLLTFK